MVERKLTYKRIQQLGRNKVLLEKLQDPDASVSITSTVLSDLLRIGHTTLCRDILGTNRFALRDDPNDPKRRIVTAEEFKQLKGIVAEIKGVK